MPAQPAPGISVMSTSTEPLPESVMSCAQVKAFACVATHSPLRERSNERASPVSYTAKRFMSMDDIVKVSLTRSPVDTFTQ